MDIEVQGSGRNRAHVVTVTIDGVSDAQYEQIQARLEELGERESKARRAIASTFIEAVQLCPDANPSDLWHHIIYRIYDRDFGKQSWVRASGDALEIAFCEIYNPTLAGHGVRMVANDKTSGTKAMSDMGIADRIGPSKLDITIEGYDGSTWRIFGGAHSKASLAERIADDIPASEAMIEAGYWSAFMTLDVKSFPPPKDCVNRGELGFPKHGGEALKRNYFEKAGSFSACFSYNLRTPPTAVDATVPGSRIYTLGLNGPQPDAFVTAVVEQWNAAKPKSPALPATDSTSSL
jgi:hypothetical protein